MRLYRMLETIDSCPAPVVCCVHGFALGGGSGLVACADIAVAWPDAVFGFTEVRLGIIPAVISPFVLAEDRQRGTALLRDGERFDAEVALRIGLVSRGRRRTRASGPRRSSRHPRGRARSPSARRSSSCASDRIGDRDRAHRRRPAHERRGPGRASRVPRAAPARLDAAVRPVLGRRNGLRGPPWPRRRQQQAENDADGRCQRSNRRARSRGRRCRQPRRARRPRRLRSPSRARLRGRSPCRCCSAGTSARGRS